MARRVKLSTAKAFARIKARTNAIIVGREYFLSSFYDREGAMVRVISKSHKENSCGWPSTVTVESVRPITDAKYEIGAEMEHLGNHQRKFYAPGTVHTCNATNLYDRREDANHKARR